MSSKKLLAKRVTSVLLIISGLLLGVTWNRARFCVGDEIFTFFGLSPWSNGNKGLHYPAIVGTLLILAGTGLLNSTLGKKARTWLYAAVIVLLIAMNLILSYI